MNRLSDATSPYLLQHASNPVDWWPWSDEAFAQARARDVPVLLSVGYSACHWCHVMAHESFEDPQTATLLNENLVAIKVDREERPDVDAVYMAATQAMTGQGGWPMTVFMTPDGEPFYCGTYFPRDYFQRLVLGVAKAWREDRDGVQGQAGRITAALAEQAAPAGPIGRATAGPAAGELAGLCDEAVAALAAGYDSRRGGFGRAPKFPPSMVLEFLLRHSERPGRAGERAGSGEPGSGPAGRGPAGEADGDGGALAMAVGTAHAMARGGMYDQLGGGFARYSVDPDWVVPHFEKMLYDNALLARVYAHLWRRTGDPLARRVAQETCAWMIRELRTPEGGFASALDADSEGEEGLFYTWTPAELAAELASDDAQYAARTLGVTEAGTFEHGRSVLQLRADPADPGRFARVRQALLAARERRVRPGRDDKVVAAWNGLAIAALAECGLLLAEPDFIAAATGAAGLLARVHLRDQRLARTSRAGVAGPSAGVLEDYACVAEGLLALSGVTGEAGWLTLAGDVLETALTRFADGGSGFYDTADDSEALIYRPGEPVDGPTPSGTFAVAGALLGYGALTGSARHREAAVGALGVLGAVAGQYPRAAGAGLAVAEAVLAGPAEIAVVGPVGDPRTAALHVAALLAAPPGAVIALGDGTDVDGDAGAPRPAGTVPLLAGRGLVAGHPAVYVCRDFTCRMPVTDPMDLRAVLAYPAQPPSG
jgi:uncharacterized protein